MSQDFTDDCYGSDHVVQTDMANIEKNFAALKSTFSGAAAPSNLVAGMWWFDTTANILKLRNEANNAWQSVWDFANNKPIVTNNVSADFGAALKDPAVDTAGLRTIGTGALQAMAGNAAMTPDDGTVTGIKLLPYTVGDYVECSNTGSATSMSYAKAIEIKLFRSGTIRTVMRSTNNPSGTDYGRIYRNGVALGAANVLTMNVDVSEDLGGWSVDDLCQLYAYNIHGDPLNVSLSVNIGNPLSAVAITL